MHYSTLKIIRDYIKIYRVNHNYPPNTQISMIGCLSDILYQSFPVAFESVNEARIYVLLRNKYIFFLYTTTKIPCMFIFGKYIFRVFFCIQVRWQLHRIGTSHVILLYLTFYLYTSEAKI